MANVVVISTSIVQPKIIEQSNHVKIHLTPFDFSFFRADYPKRGIIFYKPDKKTEIISQLKASLSISLEIFYPFVGRLVKVENQDETTSFYINCDGSNGVKFVHAKAQNVTVSDVIEPKDGFIPDLTKYFLANGMKSYQGVSNPLLAVQATELKDGLFLCWSLNHLVADGFSEWDFVNTWAKICSKGSSSVTCKSFTSFRLREWFLDNIVYSIHIPISESNVCSIQDISASPFLREKIFRFTKQQISKLKAKANEEIGSSIDVKISSFQAILGHMWRSIIKQGSLNREREVRFKFAVGLRQRINPRLDEKKCFGNMVAFGMAITTAGELVEQGIGRAALRINESVRLQTKENIKTFAESWVKDVKIQNLGGGGGKECDTLLVAGSPRFNVYENDFGWGKPIAVRAGPGILGNGKIMIFPGNEEGSMDAQICLSYDLFLKLLADEEFLENVTIM